MPSYNRYRKVTDMLMDKIQPPDGKPGVLHFDDLISAFIEVGILPEDYHQYDGVHKKYLDTVRQERDALFKSAFNSWRTQLRHFELVAYPDPASMFKTTKRKMSFGPLKEDAQDKMRNDHSKYVQAFIRRAKVISSTSTFNAEDASELDERNNELVKFVQDKGNELLKKHGKKMRIQ